MNTQTEKNKNPRFENRKARFDYEIIESYEAGIKLEGWEVVAIKAGKATLTNSYVILNKGEVLLEGMNVTPKESTSLQSKANPLRARILLLNKKEIKKISEKVEQDRMTIVPLEMYWKGSLLKVKIAVAKGKNSHDKRDTIKERDIDLGLKRSFRR